VWVLTKRYLQSFWVRNFVFHPLAFGQIHYIHAILTWLIVVPRKENRAVLFGEHTGWRRYVATQIVPKDLQQSIFRSMTHAVRVAGLSVTYRKPRLLFAYDVTKQSVLHRPYVVVHPFAASSVRTLPRERWSDLLIFIATTFPAYQIVVSGGPVDRLEAKSLCTAHNKAIFIKEVSASFAETIQIIADAALYVGVDTGPTHLAAHLEVPMIVIGNNSNPCWLPTYAENVTILTHDEHCTCTGDKKGECFVYRDGTRYYRCMIEIPQETITQHISMILRDKQH